MSSEEQDKATDTEQPEEGEGRMSLFDHLSELRKRMFYAVIALIVATLAAFAFREQVFMWLAEPLREHGQDKMQVLGLTEMFITYLKLSALAGVFITAPFLLYQMWAFVAPGLYSHEKKWVAPFVIMGTLFFLAGGAFGYYLVLPLAFKALIAMVPAAIETNYRVADYFSLVTVMLLLFGLVFELPLVMWLLSAIRLIGPATYSKIRKYWLVASVVIGAMLTPPDPVTQVMMAVPLVLFFELGILGAKVLYKKPQ